MSARMLRPTLKFLYAGYRAVLLIVAAVAAASINMQWPLWVPGLSALLFLWPLRRHLQNRLTTMTILDDKLRYETGLLTKATRTILISRVQDLTVHQRVGQRIFGVGDLSIETAGEKSRLTIPEIDRPQEIADYINDLSQKGASKERFS